MTVTANTMRRDKYANKDMFMGDLWESYQKYVHIVEKINNAIFANT